MKKQLGEQGEANALLVSVVSLAILFIAAAVFAVWAFSSRQDYKNHTDLKIAAAVAANKTVVQAADAKVYAEAAKNPLKVYFGPDNFGSVRVSYPKTWSAYVDTTDSGTPVNAYFHSDFVPATESNATYNLRVQITGDSYDQELQTYTDMLQSSDITAVPYSLPKVPKVVGMRVSGAIFDDDPTQQGSVVLLPLRDKTLKIWTESASYLNDFNTYILPNITFSP